MTAVMIVVVICCVHAIACCGCCCDYERVAVACGGCFCDYRSGFYHEHGHCCNCCCGCRSDINQGRRLLQYRWLVAFTDMVNKEDSSGSHAEGRRTRNVHNKTHTIQPCVPAEFRSLHYCNFLNLLFVLPLIEEGGVTVERKGGSFCLVERVTLNCERFMLVRVICVICEETVGKGRQVSGS